MGPIGTSRALRRSRARYLALAVLAVIATSIVVHHPAPVADHGDGHHHAVAELLLCLTLAGAVVVGAAACTRALAGAPSGRAVSVALPDPWVQEAPRPRARAGPPGLQRVLRM